MIALLLTASLLAPIPQGPAKLSVPPLTVFTYKPASYRDGPLIVVLHGSSRDADVYRDRARTLGDRFGALIVAPRFDRQRYPGYPGRTFFPLVEQLIEEIRRREARPQMPVYLIGHSAGARFLLLFAAFSTFPAQRIVAANPSTPLWPTPQIRFPRGLAGSDEATVRRYLARPLTLYIGLGDRTQDPDTRTHFEAARTQAEQRGWSFNWRLVTVPRVGHSSGEMFRRPEVGEALFGR